MKIYFAADHAGFELKNALLVYARDELGHEVEDCGALTLDNDDDYPVFISSAARKLSEDVARGVESRAIVIGASGQGEAIVANRFKGVRCVLYYGEATRLRNGYERKEARHARLGAHAQQCERFELGSAVPFHR